MIDNTQPDLTNPTIIKIQNPNNNEEDVVSKNINPESSKRNNSQEDEIDTIAYVDSNEKIIESKSKCTKKQLLLSIILSIIILIAIIVVCVVCLKKKKMKMMKIKKKK